MSKLIPRDLQSIQAFIFERLLNEDPSARSLALLGTFPIKLDDHHRAPAILRIEKTPFAAELAQSLSSDLLHEVKCIENNDIYTWLLGWFNRKENAPDVKINIIFPATEVHIRKYSAQTTCMIRETPELFHKIVKPYIDKIPPSRTQWVEDILSGKSESHKVLHRDGTKFGYVILPDMKWDLTTLSSLYLVAISSCRDIKCLRDLRKQHISMLRGVQHEASRIVKERWGLESGGLRFFIHYQPSYYHFHVHIVNANYCGLMGMCVGQAHLLDDVISLLEIDSDTGPFILERMTLTYGLGEQHGLFESMNAGQERLREISSDL
ncbi:HIT-like protein [Rickenella mellea]|uniref:HIT-like protein n=1 Tax=Rickenella mellea TaxID=50990 RepID=A0A4Y7QHX7_9AGAM|nr:HIT-like protein [Rickenella mellea]